MRFIKVIMTGAAATLSAGLLLSTSIADPSADNRTEASDKIEKENFIVNAQASATVYSDLTKVITENENANIEHYVTADTLEDRDTKISEESPVYVESDDSLEISEQKDSNEASHGTNNAGSEYKASTNNSNSAAKTDNGSEADTAVNGSTAQTGNSPETNISENATDNGYVNPPAASGSVNTDNSDSSSVTSRSDSGTGNTTADAGGSNGSAAATPPVNASATTDANTEEGNSSADSNTDNSSNYGHTTSIYTNDSTLLRVEYYNDNNKLIEYSDVTDYDADTKSYTETVYRYDEENDVEIAVRTNTYENGELVSSESH